MGKETFSDEDTVRPIQGGGKGGGLSEKAGQKRKFKASHGGLRKHG